MHINNDLLNIIHKQQSDLIKLYDELKILKQTNNFYLCQINKLISVKSSSIFLELIQYYNYKQLQKQYQLYLRQNLINELKYKFDEQFIFL